MKIELDDGQLECGQNRNIELNSHDHLTVSYVDPAGRTQRLSISTMHFVMMVEHHNTGAVMLARPSVGVQYIAPPTPNKVV